MRHGTLRCSSVIVLALRILGPIRARVMAYIIADSDHSALVATDVGAVAVGDPAFGVDRSKVVDDNPGQ